MGKRRTHEDLAEAGIEVEPPEQLDLIPDLDEIPPPLKSAATKYKNASIAKGKAGEKFKAAKENLLALMEDEKIFAVAITIDGVSKVLYRDETATIKERERKNPPPAKGNDE